MDSVFIITGTTLMIHLPAEVDHHSSEQIRKEADRLIQSRNIRCIFFDFAKTTFMDSSGIGMLIGRYKMMRFLGGAVLAVRVSERMQRILTMAGIYKIIDIYEEMPPDYRMSDLPLQKNGVFCAEEGGQLSRRKDGIDRV